MLRSPAATPRARRSVLRQVSGGAGALLALTLLLGACDETKVGADTASARVHGTVRDAASGKRLKGVRVAYTADTLEQFKDKSDEDGEYSLLVDSRALHGRIEARKDGYAARVVSVYLDAQEVRIDVDLNRE
jgi:hypothetical protein